MDKILIRIVACFIVLLSINACSEGINYESSEILSNLEGKKTREHIKIHQTRIFALLPESYKYNAKINRYQISGKQHIHFNKFYNLSWKQCKEGFKGKENFKKFRLQEYEGLITEIENPETHHILVLFGGEDFSFMITAHASKEIPEAREEMIAILQSLHYDKDFELDELELANFTFDKSILNYDVIAAGNDSYIYASDKNQSLTSPSNNTVVFGWLPEKNPESDKMHFRTMISRNEKASIEFKNKELKPMKIGDYDAMVLETEIVKDEQKGILFYVQLKDEHNGLEMSAMSFDEIKPSREKFQKTIESVRFK